MIDKTFEFYITAKLTDSSDILCKLPEFSKHYRPLAEPFYNVFASKQSSSMADQRSS